MSETNLNTLEPGERGTILRITAKGTVRQRIAEMGLSPGAVVTMVRRAPLNDPLEFIVRGYHITLRNSEAADIVVDVREA